jgi:hypothetical protein
MVVITIVFIGFATWSQHTLSTSAEKLGQQLNSLESAIKDDNWSLANSELESFNRLWEKTKNTWQILINHQEVDNIDSTLAKVKQLVKLKQKTDSLVEISALRLFILHIPKKESLSLVNIL